MKRPDSRWPDRREVERLLPDSRTAHDREVLELYKDTRKDIERRGGHVLAAVPENELKAWFNREKQYRYLETGRRLDEVGKVQIAEYLHLAVVDGELKIPDVQLIVRDKEGEIKHVNLEGTSEHYRPGYVAKKDRAGFHSREYTAKVRRVKDGPDVVGSLLGR